MHRIIAVIILISIFPAYLFSEERDYPEKLEIEGSLENWTWANTQNKLALLIKNKEISEICFIEAETLQISKKIQLPDSLSIRSMEWTSDDSGLILLANKSNKFQDGVAYFDIKTRSFRDDYYFNYIGFSSCDQRYYIAYDPVSRCWATLSAGEGHPDISISRDGEEIITTNVYPGVVSVLGWQNGKLLFSSSLPLKKHLSKNKILYLVTEAPESLDYTFVPQEIVYSIDIKTGNFKQIDSPLISDIRQTSKINGQFYFQYEIQEAENKTIIHMW